MMDPSPIGRRAEPGCVDLPAEENLVCLAADPCSDSERIAAIAGRVEDWERVETLAARHRIEPGLARAITLEDPSRAAPPELVDRSALLLASARTVAVAETIVLSELLEDFSRAGIDVMLLKGAALAETLYRDPVARRQRDIDLLVRESDLPEAGRLLKQRGYEARDAVRYRRHHFHVPFVHPIQRAGRVVELHWDVNLPGALVRFPVASWWEHPRRLNLAAGSVSVPPAEEEAAYLAWHAFSRGMPLLRDIAEFSRVWFGLEEREEAAVRAARRAGALAFLNAALSLGRQIYPHLLPPTGAGGPAPRGTRGRLQHSLFSLFNVIRSGTDAWWPMSVLAYWSLLPPEESRWPDLASRTLRAARPALAESPRWRRPLIRARALGTLGWVALRCLSGGYPVRRPA